MNGAVVLDVRLTGGSANGQLLAFYASVPKLLNAGDRHKVRRLRETEVHERDQALPTREDPSVVAEIPQYRERFSAVSYPVVLEAHRLHSVFECKHYER